MVFCWYALKTRSVYLERVSLQVRIVPFVGGELDYSGSSVFGAVFVQDARLPPHPTPIT